MYSCEVVGFQYTSPTGSIPWAAGPSLTRRSPSRRACYRPGREVGRSTLARCARAVGIEIGRLPTGARNAITDIEGIRVGHTTLIEGDAVRTGVTVIVPPPEPFFAGAHRINGNGELTGLEWIRDSGLLTTPVALTNTHSVGVVRDAVVAAHPPADWDWALPVVGETWDGVLNDIGGQHVTREHVFAAFGAAAAGAVAEGSVGGGTGMVCHGFKGGIGTRLTGRRGQLDARRARAGKPRPASALARQRRPVGERIGADVVPLPAAPAARARSSSCSRPTPLLPGQCERLARRAGFGIARTGGMGEHSSGDFALCFATGNAGLTRDEAEIRSGC